MRLALYLSALVAAASPAAAQRQALGIYGLWGAFREPGRCYAIARPDQVRGDNKGDAFASIGTWPRRGVRGQLHIRLSRVKRPGSAVLLRIDDRTFQLLSGGADAWAPDARADADIVTAMRTGIDMTIETRSSTGAWIRDIYRLRGAPTAIDAAAIACAR